MMHTFAARSPLIGLLAALPSLSLVVACSGTGVEMSEDAPSDDINDCVAVVRDYRHPQLPAAPTTARDNRAPFDRSTTPENLGQFRADKSSESESRSKSSTTEASVRTLNKDKDCASAPPSACPQAPSPNTPAPAPTPSPNTTPAAPAPAPSPNTTPAAPAPAPASPSGTANEMPRSSAPPPPAAANPPPAPYAAPTYRVGPNRQYKTLSQIAPLVRPGNVVEVDGDATYAGGVTFENPGLPNAKIVIRGVAANGKRPTISGGTNTIHLAGDHYIIDGFDVTQGSSRCIFHHAHDITIRNTVIHDCPNHGILGADEQSGSLTLEYSEVYRCGNGDQKHSIYMATDEVAHPGAVFRMQFCYVHDSNGGNNVKSRAERNEIYYNWVEGARYHELELIGPDGNEGLPIREDSDVVGNVLVKKNTAYVTRLGGDGTGATNGRYRFVNNTVMVQPDGSPVFRLYDGIESVEMHNNVFASSHRGSLDLMRKSDAVWARGREIIAGSNNWVQRGSSNLPSQWVGTLDGADPVLADPSSYNYHPSANSPLVNAGAITINGSSGFAFPNPLVLPTSQPPERRIPASAQDLLRPNCSPIEIGALARAL